jgi:1-acylglycerone phosphate reductase
MASPRKRMIVITGCSSGGIGAALAICFHHAGHRVFATARNLSKMSNLAALGIETIALDITSEPSIASAVATISSSLPDDVGLDILVNNAAGSYTMPVVDANLDTAKELFHVNVWSQIAVTQAFMPLLLKRATNTSRPLIVNHTSVGSLTALPWQGVYNASKAAFAMLTNTMRMELSPFNIQVVDLKTAGVQTNIISNSNANANGEGLPRNSIYQPVRELVEKAMGQGDLAKRGITPEQWATRVFPILLREHPPSVIWEGESALLVRIMSNFPSSVIDRAIKSVTKFGAVEEAIKAKTA